LGLKVVGYRYGPWKWYRGEDREYIWTGGEWEMRGEVRKWTDVLLQGQSTKDIHRNAVPSLLVPSLPYMGVHVMAEGAVVSCGPIPMCPKLVRSFRGKSGRGG
jgi:hypothetical protein